MKNARIKPHLAHEGSRSSQNKPASQVYGELRCIS